jgi:FixJ family two-component response regulator
MTVHPIRVAILDDDTAVGNALGRLLTTAEMVVDNYAAGTPFLRSLAQSHPDCLVLDLQMPGMSGVDILQYLSQQHIRIPTIVITAHDNPDAYQACLNAGAHAFLRKPLGTGQLVAMIEKICRPDGTLPSFS